MISQHLFLVLTKTQFINASIRIMSFLVIQILDHHLEIRICLFAPIAANTIQLPALVIHINHLIRRDQMNQNHTLLVNIISQLLITVYFN